MAEGTPSSWIWMIFPLAGLAVNLIWQRKRALKAVGIMTLLLAAYLHGFAGLNPLDRAVNLAERILTKQREGTPDQILSNLRYAQTQAHQTLYDVSLGLTLAVIFAATPVDIIPRLRSRSRSAPTRID